MGVVYKACDTHLDRTVALRVILLGAAAARRRRTHRRHICTLHDVGREVDTDFLVMEFLGGQTLAARLTKVALQRAQTLEYTIQITQALDRARSEGTVHCD